MAGTCTSAPDIARKAGIKVYASTNCVEYRYPKTVRISPDRRKLQAPMLANRTEIAAQDVERE
jgi:hypothetical protein